MSKIYSPSGLVVGNTQSYVEVQQRGHQFNGCVKCDGTGTRTFEVAPWVRPVATPPAGVAPAEVEVECSCCKGSGLVRL